MDAGAIVILIMSIGMLLVGVFYYVAIRLNRAVRKVHWTPPTCSKDVPWEVKAECEADRQKWWDEVWRKF